VKSSCVKHESMLGRDMFKAMLLNFLLLFCLLPIADSYGFEARGKDCSKCHILSKSEAKDLLKKIIPDVVILDIRLSSVRGFWEVYSEQTGRKGLVYIDFAKKHFFSGPLISIAERKNLTQERLLELTKIDVSQIPLDDALVMGDQKARIRVIVFSDPD
jgi:thiol:disulfide interchange protein DsbC